MTTRPGIRGFLRTAATVFLLLFVGVGLAAAQTAEPDTTEAQDSASDPPVGGLQGAGRQAATGDTEAAPAETEAVAGGPFFQGITNSPKAGVKADVSRYQYYAEWKLGVNMHYGAKLDNTLLAGRTVYRTTIKTLRTINNRLLFNTGTQLPFLLTVDGLYDWSEDETENNLIKRDARNGSLKLSRNQLVTGPLRHRLAGSAGMRRELGLNRGIENTTQEAGLTARLQTAWEINEGLVLAGRIYGEGGSGDRTLGDTQGPSTARGDTLGAGAYYDKGWLLGRAVLTTASFDARFLDWQRGRTGSPDTLRAPGESRDDQIVDEHKIVEKTAILWENDVRFGRFGVNFNLAREIDQTSYAASQQGRIEKLDESLDLESTLALGRRDSFVVGYGYSLKWDDQFYQDGTTLGRQNNRRYGADLTWYHRLFKATEFRLGMAQDLSRQVPDEVRQNGQDRDVVTTGADARLRRVWTGFNTTLLFSWSERQDVAISSNQSIQNNVRDNFSLKPDYQWDIAEWLRLSQQYTLRIEYTFWDHPTGPDGRRQDNYNKSGNLSTFLTIEPTERLELVIKHFYNRRFNATKTGENVEGSSTYRKDKIQTINTLDFALEFAAADGVIFEAQTDRKRDFTEWPGERENTNYSGRIWVGMRVNKRWGIRNPLELNLAVKKFNAFGPSVTEASADYWEADTWVKWSF